jgi:cation:H+ antiporter
MAFLVIIFALSLFFLVMGADWFLKSAEKMGLALGLSPFIVGVTIVAFGTSFPELFTSITAALMGVTEIIPANAIGSNIANILLVVGISAVIGGKLVVTKNLIDVDLPLLAIGTVILMGVIIPWGGEESVLITRPESIILLLTYGVYILYTIFHKDERELDTGKTLPTKKEKRKRRLIERREVKEKPKIVFLDWVFLFGGGLALTVSAKYLVQSIIGISEILEIGVGVISILAVALGTSLPELIVSAKAAFKGKPEIALGNIFGSNLFNSFVVIGVPGIFKDIDLDEPTYAIGFPIMILATLLFVISGISRRIHNWEGIFYLSLYVIFVGKILNLF